MQMQLSFWNIGTHYTYSTDLSVSVIVCLPLTGETEMSDFENCKTGKTFKNWAETIEFKPKFYCHPSNAAGVQSIVQRAASNDQHLRIQGNGHSWSQVLQTKDHLLQLDLLGDAVTAEAGNQVSVPAGIK